MAVQAPSRARGMTGWWQVTGRTERPMHLSTEGDLYYLQNPSVLLDVQILLRTLGAVILWQLRLLGAAVGHAFQFPRQCWP